MPLKKPAKPTNKASTKVPVKSAGKATITPARQGRAQVKSQPAKGPAKSQPAKSPSRSQPVRAQAKTQPAKSQSRTQSVKSQGRTQPAKSKAQPAKAQAKKQPARTQSKVQPAKSQLAKGQTGKAAAKTSAGKAPVKAATANAQPAQVRQVKAQPAKALPAKAQPAKAQPAKAQPAKAQPAKTQPVKAQPAQSKSAVSKAPSGRVAVPKPAVVKAPPKPRADRVAFFERQRQLLLEERDQYLRSADALKAQADSLALEHEPGDVQFDEEGGEGGTSNIDREMDLVLSAQARLAAAEIDRALAKIEAGTYGYCEQCGDLIPEARLQALPYAALCVTCKSGGLSSRR